MCHVYSTYKLHAYDLVGCPYGADNLGKILYVYNNTNGKQYEISAPMEAQSKFYSSLGRNSSSDNSEREEQGLSCTIKDEWHSVDRDEKEYMIA